MSNPRNRNLLIIIGVLLLTNIAVLIYFLGQGKQNKSVPDNAKNNKSFVAEMLQKEVGFTEKQTEEYKQIKGKQRETIRPMYDDMRNAKDSLFRLLSYPSTNDSVLNAMAEAIAQKQKALDLQTFNYFKTLRTLCTPDQLPKYDSMILPLLRKIGKLPKHNEPEKTGKK